MPPDLRRKQLGAWYTPPALVEHVLDEVLTPALLTRSAGDTVSVLDPACGDGRFLVAAAERIRRAGCRGELVGVDIDPGAVASCRAALHELEGSNGAVVHADALAVDWGTRRFDVVLGNPPFLSPLAAMHGVRMGDRAGGPYADAATEFLALALRLIDPVRGRIGLVLPLSIVSARDAAPVRESVGRLAPLDWFWFAPRPVFDAEVRTCAVGLAANVPNAEVRRSHGKQFARRPAVVRPSDPVAAGSWAWVLADELGIPELPALSTAGTLADVAVCGADFRDEYYGLDGMVEEDDGTPGARLITSGLIDPGVSRWGERPTKLHRRPFERPVVRLERLTGPMAAWAVQRSVPKVLVASQTRVVEALADPDGTLLPSVPVVSITPQDPADVWRIAAALTGPVPSVWLARRASGSGMSAAAMRVSAPVLAGVPLPHGSLDRAVAALRAGDVEGCARWSTAAYGVEPDAAVRLLEWWLSASRVRTATLPPARR